MMISVSAAKRKPFEYCFTSKPLPHHLIAPA
jgi:hypothetical protein